jgi:hypothetical protein
MKHSIPWVTLFCVFATHAAHADKVAAKVCAASLQPHARLVFDSVTATPHPELTLRSLIESKVRELIFMDRLMITAARPAAEAASECLRIARNCVADRC